MIRSLRARLILGTMLGMAALLLAAGMTIYTVQRRHLTRAFDKSLLGSANSLVLLIHHRTPEFWFDFKELAALPDGQIRQGALFQFWSNYPIDLSSPMSRLDFPGGDRGPGWDEPPWFDSFDGPGGPPSRRGPPREPPDLRDPRDLREPPEPRRRRTASTNTTEPCVIRSPSLNGVDLPRLDSSPGESRFEDVALPDGTRGRAVGVTCQFPIPMSESRRNRTADVTVVVAAPTGELDMELRFLAVLLAATAVGTMAVAACAAWLTVTRGLRPLGAVATEIAALDETGLKQRIAESDVPKEINPVVKQLNGLLARLDEAFERERALTAAVAHELRTPVSEVRAIAEITLNRSREPEEYRRALAETLDATRNLQNLIEKLLILARLEAGRMKPELEPVPLKPLVAQQWNLVRSHAEPRGVTFDDRCSGETLVSADLNLLEVVIANALSNAAAYVPDGGRITVETEPIDEHCRLVITNTGCELREDEIAKVFDRFWRADAARSRTGVNCGLGLTLVRRAMEAMGGSAEARVNSDRCFALTLTFKAVAEACVVPA